MPEDTEALGAEDEPEDSISRFIDTGGKKNGREVDNSRTGRRVNTENAGKQIAGSTESSRSLKGIGTKGGMAERESRSSLFDTDSEGRRIDSTVSKRIKGTSITDSKGRPLAVYHATDKVFDTFAVGDVGFHFGNHNQAEGRVKKQGYKNPIYIRAYLNIKNPAVVNKDPMSWHSNAVALLLWDAGILTLDERKEIDELWEFNAGYDHPSSVKLREILKSKGYDGIAYENGFEGEGTSYIAFDDSQIVRAPVDTTENADGLEPHPEYWEAERVGGKREVKPISSIIADIQHDFGLNITTGHIRGAGVRGQYDSVTNGIRTRIANDLPTVAHELGHALNRKYKLINGITREMAKELENGLSDEMKDSYESRLWISEGLAEFVSA